MADNKKYYWLKLKRDFFKRHDIRIIESMPNGKDYILFYLKLLLESIDHEGELRFSDTIPYNEAMLATITDTNIDIVRSAMKLFLELNMIELFDDQTIFMSEVQKMIGSETKAAERMRKSREKKQKALECNNVTKCYTEIELEKEKEKEIEKESNLSIYQEAKPKKAMIDRLIDENIISDIKNQIEYDFLKERIDFDELDLAVSCVADLYTTQEPLQFNGRHYSPAYIHKQAEKINSSHVEYVFECLTEQKEKVRNIRSYLLTAIFNAPDSMGSYYKNKVIADGAIW